MDRLELYRTIYLIRRFEERVEALFRAGKIPGLYLRPGPGGEGRGEEGEASGIR